MNIFKNQEKKVYSDSMVTTYVEEREINSILQGLNWQPPKYSVWS